MPLRILHVSDTHLRGGVTAETPPVEFSDAVQLLTGASTDELTAKLIEHALAEAGPFDAAVHTGDIADAVGPAGWAAAKTLLEQASPQVLATPGNHDDPADFEATFGPDLAPPVSYADLGSWRIALINSSRPPVSGGQFTERALAQLDAALTGERPTVVATHHPPLSPCGDAECTIENAWAFLDVLDRHKNVRGVISGHLHLADDVERRGVQYLLAPSTALQLIHDHPLAEADHPPSRPGARILDLADDGTLTSQLIWA